MTLSQWCQARKHWMLLNNKKVFPKCAGRVLIRCWTIINNRNRNPMKSRGIANLMVRTIWVKEMKVLQPRRIQMHMISMWRDYRTICAMCPLNESIHCQCLDKYQIDRSIMHHCLLLLILWTIVRYLTKLQQVKIGNQLSYRAIVKMHTKKRKTNHFILVFVIPKMLAAKNKI